MSYEYKNSILQSVTFDLETAKSNPTPDVLRIEVTNGCNDRCIFCGNRKMSRPIGFIKEELVEKALKQSYEMGVRKVSFYTIGEPFLHPELSKFVAKAMSIGFQYSFTNTNGAHATQDSLRAVAKAGISSIAFSINAISPKDYLLIHGKNDFNTVIENLIWLRHYRENNDLDFHLYVSFIKTRLTNYDENEIREFFSDKCDEVRIQNVQNIGGFLPEIDLLGVDSSDLYFHYELPCRLIFKSIIVTCEGYLTACSVDYQNYLVYADLNDNDIPTAWQNNTISELRKQHLEGKVTGLLCDNCVNFSKENPNPLMHKYSTEFDMSKVLSSCEAKERILIPISYYLILYCKTRAGNSLI
jgi:pyruvate-formate lyase-activating enzyme